MPQSGEPQPWSQRATEPGPRQPTHVPAEQFGVAPEQIFPHSPQLLGSAVTSFSQPSTCKPLQLPKPGLHVPTPHAPLAQKLDAFGDEQTVPHAPQLLGSIEVSVQEPPHCVAPPAHFSAQAPLEQT